MWYCLSDVSLAGVPLSVKVHKGKDHLALPIVPRAQLKVWHTAHAQRRVWHYLLYYLLYQVNLI